jgi:hypothetical protein
MSASRPVGARIATSWGAPAVLGCAGGSCAGARSADGGCTVG